jgi:hypothetical protein
MDAIPADEGRSPEILMGQARVLAEAYDVLAENERRDAAVGALLLGSRKRGINMIPDAEPDRVFRIRRLERLCVTYRLRFLDATYFKGTLPPQAVHALARLEDRSGRPLRGLKVMASAGRFRSLSGTGCAFLFVPMGGQRYYLVHQWGLPPGPRRAMGAWPLRGPWQLGATVMTAALMIAALMPNAWVGVGSELSWWGSHRLLGMLWTTMVATAFTVFAWFAFHGRFSREAWDGPRS